MNKRIMVDMSTALIHHGHIRLLKKASEFGDVIVGLTADNEVLSKKGYTPELSFKNRKEVLESIKYVSEVVSTPWLIDESVLDRHNINLLVHGDDNCNLIRKNRLKILPRTKGISSSDIRNKVVLCLTQINNQKLMLTPGPAVVLHENLTYLKPIFGRGDGEYAMMEYGVQKWVKKLSGQDEVVIAQGSATFALELAAHSFVSGKVLLISTGYYSDRLKKLLPKKCSITICQYEELTNISDKFDWVLCAYTETSVAFKLNLQIVRDKATEYGAKLFVDATGSIGLEEKHNLADVMAFSSCQGLFGLTGACFVAYKSVLKFKTTNCFYFNLETHKNKMTTGPYHAIASLYGVIKKHDIFRRRVIDSKHYILEKYKDIVRNNNQPLLCTYLKGKVIAKDDNVVLYTPRSELSGSIICHLGEIHHDVVNLDKRIEVNV